MSANDKQPTLTAIACTNVLLGILAAGIAIAFIYLQFFYQPQLSEEQAAAYATEAQERLAEHAGEIQEEVTSVATETIPPLSSAIYEQTKEDYPVYVKTLEEQGDIYLANAENILVEKVKGQYREYLSEHREVLKEEFPEHASEENVQLVMNEFEKTFDKLVQRYYLDEFRQQSERTVALWKEFEPVSIPGPNEPSLNEQLADYVADWTALMATQQVEQEVATTESN